MAESIASVFLEDVKKALGLSRDVDLAKALGVGKSTVASWRIRGKVPGEVATSIEQLSGVSIKRAREKFYSAGGTARALAKLHFFTHLATLFANTTDDVERRQLAVAISIRLEEILAILAHRATVSEPDGLSDKRTLQLATMTGLNDLTTPDELRAWATWHFEEDEVPQSVPQSADDSGAVPQKPQHSQRPKR